MSFARFITVPENRSALLAMEHLTACVCSGRWQRIASPIFLHGPTGSGKSCLVAGLVEEVSVRSPSATVCLLQASDFDPVMAGRETDPAEEAEPFSGTAALDSDLLIVEDVQRLCRHREAMQSRAIEAFVQILDHRESRQRPSVLTANAGPTQLGRFSFRLLSRLTAGLVLGMESLRPASRLVFLEEKAQRRQLAVRPDVLQWLADHLAGGGRQLEGAIQQLEALAKLHCRPVDVAIVAAHFSDQAEAGRPTLERIADRVGTYFQVQPRHLQSRRRYQKVLLPRQVGMYLARQLTEVSLQQIGRYFGGRDHSTVLHACRKIEKELTRNAVLSGTVRQLHADLV